MAGLLPITLGILLMTGVGKALIPKPCANAGNFTNRECCPTPERLGPNAGACGSNLNRGACVQIPNGDMVNRSDARQYWPHFFFTRVCRCNSNYGGYDCGECAFGYQGPNCDQPYIRQRRSTSVLTNEEWTTYINQLQRAKSSTESRYRVITSPPDYNNPGAIQTVDIGVYNLFVWFHHYVAKDNDGDSFDENDYAHEATGFPTWHRLFLLWFEREMQVFLNDTSFTIHYWDWRDRNQRTSLFQQNRLGGHDTQTISGVTGQIGGWQTVCWYNGSGNIPRPDNMQRICDPGVPTGLLQRCPNKTTCAADYAGWPSSPDVQDAVRMSSYDSSPYNKVPTGGFRGYMEGFVVVDQCDEQTDRGRDLCTDVTINGMPKGIQRLLHNTVHITLGIGRFGNSFAPRNKGVMGDVAASANDPIFINHHAMVDCILEKWLQDHRTATYPNQGTIRTGHRRDDYIVPFIPLYTHNMMFSLANNFGYSCNIPDSQPTAQPPPATRPPPATEPDSAKSSTALLHLLVLVMLGIVALIL